MVSVSSYRSAATQLDVISGANPYSPYTNPRASAASLALLMTIPDCCSQVDGRHHFASNRATPLGRTILRDRLLTARRWHVVCRCLCTCVSMHDIDRKDARIAFNPGKRGASGITSRSLRGLQVSMAAGSETHRR